MIRGRFSHLVKLDYLFFSIFFFLRVLRFSFTPSSLFFHALFTFLSRPLHFSFLFLTMKPTEQPPKSQQVIEEGEQIEESETLVELETPIEDLEREEEIEKDILEGTDLLMEEQLVSTPATNESRY